MAGERLERSYVADVGEKRRINQSSIPSTMVDELKAELKSITTAHTNLNSLLTLLKLMRADLETVAANSNLVTYTNQRALEALKPPGRKGIAK